MTYSKENPFLAAITERSRLTTDQSDKSTWHITLDLKESGITYQPGDCIAVLPTNCEEVVNRTLAALDAPHHTDIQGIALKDFLTSKANITQLNKKIIRALVTDTPLQSLLDDREKLAHFIEHHELWDLLEMVPSENIHVHEVCALLPPILPRYYSIASSYKVVGNEVHLLIRHLSYTSREVCRQGVCTHFLTERAPIGEKCVPIYHHPATTFTLPPDPHTPMIMIGPGTGVAPYRGFMQERVHHGATGRHLLFFGEQRQEHDFFYRDYWTQLVNQGHLHLETAFSRDQSEKVYVQHRMLDRADTIWNLLQEGAHFYVCGDAKRMAKDVERTLQIIAQTEGNLSPEEARTYIKQLRRTNRYLTDVY